jgi:putative restriction endonuclease
MYDGPLLEHGLKAMAGRRILRPDRFDDAPDRERLDLRFQQFRKAA